MSTEKDLLAIWKERIATESKRGDKAKALRRVSITAPTYNDGMKKQKLEDLTENELIAIEAHIQVLDEKKEELRKKVEQYAAN